MTSSLSTSLSSSDSDRNLQGRRRLYRRHTRKKPTHNILRLIRDYVTDDETFSRNFGLNKEDFATLQNMLIAQIHRSLSKFRNMKSIRARDRLGLCLRFLASGKSFKELSEMYNVQAGVLETIVREVCNIILQQLRPIVMPHPTKQMWENIAAGFKAIHKIPNCIGSVNGRYVNIMNQKLFIFLALVDANCKFVMIDVGDYDSNPQKIWDNSEMVKRFEEDDIKIPSSRRPSPNCEPLPFVVVGGNSFPQKQYLITKFSEKECDDNDVYKVFNWRIHHVKGAADEALTRLRRRWRIIQSSFPVPPAIVERIIMATCCLENYFSAPPI